MRHYVQMIDEEIEKLESFVSRDRDTWEEFEEESQSMYYEGAGCYFGHADDCFEAGSRYAKWLRAKESLEFLRGLRAMIMEG